MHNVHTHTNTQTWYLLLSCRWCAAFSWRRSSSTIARCSWINCCCSCCCLRNSANMSTATSLSFTAFFTAGMWSSALTAGLWSSPCDLSLTFNVYTQILGYSKSSQTDTDNRRVYTLCFKKNWVVGCWRGYLGWGADLPSRCHCHSLSLAPVNPDWFYLPGLTFLVPAHLVVPDRFQKSSKTIVCCVCFKKSIPSNHLW